MRLLDRYLFRELIVPLGYCLAGFLIFWISFDLFTELDEFQKAEMSGRQISRYYLYRTPELLVTVLPVGLLLALLYALTNHARHNEIIAMRAAGLSLGRISVPYLVVGFILSLALFALNELAAPEGSAKAQRIRSLGGRAHSDADDWRRAVNFRNARENRIWTIAALNTETFEMVHPHVDWRQPDGRRKVIIAQTGALTNGQWVFRNAEIFNYEPKVDFEQDPRPLRTNELAVPEFTEKPEDIRLQLKFQQISAIEASKRTQLALKEIRYLRRHLELNPRDSSLLQTQWHARIAQPWTCLVVALVALPFGAGTNSRGNVFVGVAASIFICFAYFILLRFGLALGTGGFIPPPVAAWLPNMAFSLLGVFLLWRIK
jgi:lipopolysaccharide export system permease protein